MDEKKKISILIGVVVATILLIIFGSLYESHKSNKYLDEFYTAFNGSEEKLVMIGRDNCSWCQLFKPNLDFMRESYGFDYIYINTNELTSGSLNKLLNSVGVDRNEFGTPLTVVVKDSTVVDSLNGYKLMMNYVDYSAYKKILKSEETKILVIGQTSCTYCIKAKPILNKVINDKNVKINYLNITELSDEEKEKFNNSLSYLSENEWGTPLTLILKNGEVVDSANGLLDYDGYVKLFEDNGLIK